MWELSRDRVEMYQDNKLGSGAFSIVYKGDLCRQGNVSINTLQGKSKAKRRFYASMQREVRNVRRLRWSIAK